VILAISRCSAHCDHRLDPSQRRFRGHHIGRNGPHSVALLTIKGRPWASSAPATGHKPGSSRTKPSW
jgi:hypothetical protein